VPVRPLAWVVCGVEYPLKMGTVCPTSITYQPQNSHCPRIASLDRQIVMEQSPSLYWLTAFPVFSCTFQIIVVTVRHGLAPSPSENATSNLSVCGDRSSVEELLKAGSMIHL
jgi:hypothetical protein